MFAQSKQISGNDLHLCINDFGLARRRERRVGGGARGVEWGKGGGGKGVIWEPFEARLGSVSRREDFP